MIRRPIEAMPQPNNPGLTANQTRTQFMKSSSKKPLAPAPQTPVFPQMLHRLRPNFQTTAYPKPPKRDNTFSKSRDTNEDRGRRQIKTSHATQSFNRGR